MKATFLKTAKGTWACIQKSIRIDGRSTTKTVLKLGLLDDISKKYGCDDPERWVRDLAKKMTEDEKAGNNDVSISFSPTKVMDKDRISLRNGGDLFMRPLFNALGLADICGDIVKDTRAKYDLGDILRTLVFSRILAPGSKIKSYEFAKHMVNPPKFSENDMYRALTLLSNHIDDIQARMYTASKGLINRKERVIYFDCTNFYFELEDNDKDYVDIETGEVTTGLRKCGNSKEHRPNPIVQMGLFMDGDGIPLAFNIFPGNESEQIWLQPLENTLGRKFDLTEFVVSTDAGLASEANRRYNMAEGRDYICVQSLKSLKSSDQEMALGKEGWRIAYCPDKNRIDLLPTEDPDRTIFNLEQLRDAEAAAPGLLKGITFYREIIVEKTFKYINPKWLEMEKKNKGAQHKDRNGKLIPKELSVNRNERIIVTYSHDFAQFLEHKRQERLKASRAIVKNKKKKGRQSQQSPYRYVNEIYHAKDGAVATKVEMVIDNNAVKEDAKFDGFYAYGTSLDDDAIDILKARSFHHEIEHLFRTTKTFLEARPVYLSRADRIKSHFLICFIAMTIIKIMHKQLKDTNAETYREQPLSIDSLIHTLRDIRFTDLNGRGYIPVFTRTTLTDQMQELANVNVNTQIIKPKDMKAAYRSVK